MLAWWHPLKEVVQPGLEFMMRLIWKAEWKTLSFNYISNFFLFCVSSQQEWTICCSIRNQHAKRFSHYPASRVSFLFILQWRDSFGTLFKTSLGFCLLCIQHGVVDVPLAALCRSSAFNRQCTSLKDDSFPSYAESISIQVGLPGFQQDLFKIIIIPNGLLPCASPRPVESLCALALTSGSMFFTYCPTWYL